MSWTFEMEWRRSLDSTYSALEAALPYYTDPDRLLGSPQYRKQPDRAWLGAFLTALSAARHLLKLRAHDVPEAEMQRVVQLVQAAGEAIEEHLTWVSGQLHGELAALVGHYHRADGVQAVQEGVPHEFWFILNERSTIQAHLEASDTLHPALMADADLVRQVRDTDDFLRNIGPALWQADPPSDWPPEERSLYYPREHWWWCLDQGP